MKKLITLLFVFALSISVSGLVQAATSEDFHLVVVVATDEISIDVTNTTPGGYVNIGVVQAGNSLVTPNTGGHTNVLNNGYGTIRLQLQGVTNAGHTGNWTQRTDAPGSGLLADEYRLSGIFTQWDRAGLAEADFVDGDVFQIAATDCDATTHALDSEADSFKGFNVAPGSSKALHYLFEAPGTVSNPGELLIDIVISAVLM